MRNKDGEKEIGQSTLEAARKERRSTLKTLQALEAIEGFLSNVDGHPDFPLRNTTEPAHSLTSSELLEIDYVSDRKWVKIATAKTAIIEIGGAGFKLLADDPKHGAKLINNAATIECDIRILFHETGRPGKRLGDALEINYITKGLLFEIDSRPKTVKISVSS